MGKKSDGIPSLRISATEASRSFSELLDRVAAGHRFLIHRHGKDVCVMASPPVRGRKISECLSILRGRPTTAPDDGLAGDVLEVIATEPLDEPPRWDS